MKSALATLQAAGLALAAVVASFLTWAEATGRELPCPVSESGGCAQVLASAWSRIGPIPTAALGAIFACAMLLLRWRAPGSRLYPLGLGIGLVAAVALQLYSRLAVHAVCLYCLAFASLLFLACLAAVADRTLAPERLLRPQGALVGAAALLGSLAAVLLVRFGDALPTSARLGNVPDLQRRASELPILGDATRTPRLLMVADPECPLCRDVLRGLTDASGGPHPACRLLLWPRTKEGKDIAGWALSAAGAGRLSPYLSRYLSGDRSSSILAENVALTMGLPRLPVSRELRQARELVARLRPSHTPLFVLLDAPPRVVPLATFVRMGAGQ